ncbi:hypothetical protein KC19_12G062600 [Ceratodon purpureus]|uniref:Uncharacterized protein n=1 Tax=Ceratodon purpureus TaxID=3225 RepID=A0A8T0G4Y1_CERPU|nr:hypothetical protein KC19_12G062600 [Ceratodon purpureus]
MVISERLIMPDPSDCRNCTYICNMIRDASLSLFFMTSAILSKNQLMTTNDNASNVESVLTISSTDAGGASMCNSAIQVTQSSNPGYVHSRIELQTILHIVRYRSR